MKAYTVRFDHASGTMKLTPGIELQPRGSNCGLQIGKPSKDNRPKFVGLQLSNPAETKIVDGKIMTYKVHPFQITTNRGLENEHSFTVLSKEKAGSIDERVMVFIHTRGRLQADSYGKWTTEAGLPPYTIAEGTGEFYGAYAPGGWVESLVTMKPGDRICIHPNGKPLSYLVMTDEGPKVLGKDAYAALLEREEAAKTMTLPLWLAQQIAPCIQGADLLKAEFEKYIAAAMPTAEPAV